MSQLQITELDFAGIKQNLRNFLRNQEEFSDYNFEGSALSVIIDLLAYNTHYNAVLAHLMANEMFLDSAVKRSSVLSIAKTLGYTPRSTTSARVRVDVVVSGGSSTTLTMTPDDTFVGTVDNTNYLFSPTETHVANLENGQYRFTDVELIEGRRFTNTFVVGSDTISGPFTIPVNSVDTNTLRVYVRDTVSSSNYEVFSRVDSISNLTDTSAVFWIEETGDGRYQILFGNDIFGKSLRVGNLVVAEYVSSSGSIANGIRSLSGADVDNQSVLEVIVREPSAGGSEKETIDSIRKTAPIFNAAKNRVVTTQDYKALIQKNFDKAKSVTVWGGEENDPPIYGKVFITVDTVDDYIFTEADRDFIIEKILRPASVMSIQHEFVEPEYLYIGLHTHVNYDPRKTNFTASQISGEVRKNIEDYFAEELSTLEKPFFYSRLNDVINSASSSIIANVIKMTLQNRIFVEAGTSVSKTINFLASLEPETIKSTLFVVDINGITYTAYLQDFANTTIRKNSSVGSICLVDATNDRKIINVGEIDYVTGRMFIRDVRVISFLDNSGEIRITAEPTDLSKNISSTIIRTTEISPNAVTPLPSRNIIIKLDDSEANSRIQQHPGLQVSATPFIDN